MSLDHDHGSGVHEHGTHEHGTHSHPVPPRAGRALRIGIGGPVGSGKTALVAALCRALRDEVNLAVVTNDIYTTEDADFLQRAGVLDPDRITPVRTGCCPHTAIRDDIAANLDAVEDLEARFGGLDPIAVSAIVARIAPEIDAIDWEGLPFPSAPNLDLLAEAHVRAEVRLFES